MSLMSYLKVLWSARELAAFQQKGQRLQAQYQAKRYQWTETQLRLRAKQLRERLVMLGDQPPPGVSQAELEKRLEAFQLLARQKAEVQAQFDREQAALTPAPLPPEPPVVAEAPSAPAPASTVPGDPPALPRHSGPMAAAQVVWGSQRWVGLPAPGAEDCLELIPPRQPGRLEQAVVELALEPVAGQARPPGEQSAGLVAVAAADQTTPPNHP